ncbi:coatomer subunit gamma-2-like protein, partial [Tanacetum coccineum]
INMLPRTITKSLKLPLGFLMERPVTVHNAIAGLIILIAISFLLRDNLFQSKDIGLQRMVYLIIKELSPASVEVIIVTSCLMKDMNGMTDVYRANAIRNLCRNIDGTLLTQIEWYTRDCEKMEQ